MANTSTKPVTVTTEGCNVLVDGVVVGEYDMLRRGDKMVKRLIEKALAKGKSINEAVSSAGCALITE